MTTDPIPSNCLPFGGDEERLLEFILGPRIDSEGRIIGETYNGMTPEEVLADRDAFNRAVGE